MNLNKRILSTTAAAALAAGALVTVTAGAAHADPIVGQLTLTPATGTTTNIAPNATLSPGCPAGSAGIVGYMSGPGVTEANGVIQGFRSTATSFPISDTYKSIFAQNAVAAPNGTYTVRITCVADDTVTETATYSQQVRFTATTGVNEASFETVVPAKNTETVLSQSAASSTFGDSVTFTADASVVGGGETAGTIQFKDGATDLGTAQTVNASGIASFTTSSLALNSHSITAVFTPTNTAGFNASTSNAVTHTVNAIATTTTLTSNSGVSGTQQYSPAVFTATVSPAVAGTVTFKEGATVLGSGTVSGGVATFSTTSLSVGTHDVTAEFVPAAGTGANGSTSAPVTHIVQAFAGVSLTQDVMVSVPAGALTMVLDGAADGDVDLGTAVMDAEGEYLTASGELDPVKVTDTRAGDPGWTASGIVTDFAKGTDKINGFNLGWTPRILSSSANQVGITAGTAVVAGTEGTATSVPSNPLVGLEASRTLAVALDDAGNGTARLAAKLDLNIPTDVPEGTYSAVLTLTVA